MCRPFGYRYGSSPISCHRYRSRMSVYYRYEICRGLINTDQSLFAYVRTEVGRTVSLTTHEGGIFDHEKLRCRTGSIVP